MPRNKIQDLRNHLFAQLENLADCDEGQLEKEVMKAKAMANISKEIINGAKLEFQFAKTFKGEVTYKPDFLGLNKPIEQE